MYSVLGFYKFVELSDPASLGALLRQWGEQLQVLGTVLLANEGINGSISANADALCEWQRRLGQISEFSDMRFTLTDAGVSCPFHKLKVKVRREIIPLAEGSICPTEHKLEYLDAFGWNQLLNDPHALIVDVRNSFEYRVGRFDGAVDAGLNNFSEFSDRVARGDWDKFRRVGMYCTGGIRCEKAASLWQSRNDAEVFQLEGGIIKYLQEIPPEQNLWRGECFVFDYRVSLDCELQIGKHSLCYGCGEPLSAAEREDVRYQYGISCPYCHGKRSPAAIAASWERLRQIELASKRGGSSPSLVDKCARDLAVNE